MKEKRGARQERVIDWKGLKNYIREMEAGFCLDPDLNEF